MARELSLFICRVLYETTFSFTVKSGIIDLLIYKLLPHIKPFNFSGSLYILLQFYLSSLAIMHSRSLFSLFL